MQIMPHDRPGTLVSILTSTLCGPSAIAELLVSVDFIMLLVTWDENSKISAATALVGVSVFL